MKLALKNTITKTACVFLLYTTLVHSAFLKEEQLPIVQDNSGVQAQLSTVITRQPTVSAVVNNMPNRLSPPSNVVYASNSNFSNASSPGSYGKTASIVGKDCL